jgi:UDP-2,3-diacylglucosamine pyrophosphatase LpxH
MDKEKKSVRALVISDLHLGEEDSVFSDNYITSKFWHCIAENYKKVDEFILLGDVIDLSQAEYSEALYGLKQFFANVPANIVKKIIIIPGNHDHHIWHESYENLIVNDTISAFKMDERFDKIDHPDARSKELEDEFARRKNKQKRDYKPDKDNYYYFDKEANTTIMNFIRANNLLKGVKLEVRYPFYNIKHNNRTTHMHHGHFFGSAYNLFTTLVAHLNKSATTITWKVIDLLLEGLYKAIGPYKSALLIMALAATMLALPIYLTVVHHPLWAVSFIPFGIIVLSAVGFYVGIHKRTKELKEKLKQGDIPELTDLKVYERVNAPQYEFLWYLLGQSPLHNLQEKAYEIFHAEAGRSLEAGETINGLKSYIKQYLNIYSNHSLSPKKLKYLLFGHTHRVGKQRRFRYKDYKGRERSITVYNTGGWLENNNSDKINALFEIGNSGPKGYRMKYNGANYELKALKDEDYVYDPLKIKAVKASIKKGLEKGKEEIKKEAEEVSKELKGEN